MSQQAERQAAQGRDETADVASDVVKDILTKCRFRGNVAVNGSGERIEISVTGPDASLLVGKKGQTLDAVQYLVNRIVGRRVGEHKPVLLDADGYRERREASLVELAQRLSEGKDFSDVIKGTKSPDNDAALIMCPVPFHQWSYKRGGREYRGVRTRRYTYVRDIKEPWLLYDNQTDPYQLKNLCNNQKYSRIQQKLEKILSRKLKETNDKFLPGPEYMAMWNYSWDGTDATQ